MRRSLPSKGALPRVRAFLRRVQETGLRLVQQNPDDQHGCPDDPLSCVRAATLASLLELAVLTRVATKPAAADPTLERLTTFAHDFGIDEIDPTIANLLATIPTLPPESHLYERLAADLADRIAPYLAYHKDEPFRVMPASASTGEIIVGPQFGDDTPVRLSLHRLNENLGIFGRTGSGKTNTVLHVIDQIDPARAKFVILEVKHDYDAWAVANPDCYLFDGEAPISLLDVAGFSPTELLAVFEERWSRALFSHERGREILYEAWAKLSFPSSLADLKRTVDSLEKKSDTYARRDAIRGTSMRLQRVSDLYPVPFRTSNGVPLSALFNHSVLFPAATLTDVTQFLFTYFVGLLTQHNLKHL